MLSQGLVHTFQRYRTLYTGNISVLPIVILMPHSACNCRCIMCDIWKGNGNLKQLTEADISRLLVSLKRLQAKQVVMSGGEALLNRNFFSLCRMIKAQQLSITLLSTGLLLEKYAREIVELVDDVIVSLDGDAATHDHIRNIPGAYDALNNGITAIRSIAPSCRITARTVIHRLNFRVWPQIIRCAKALGLNQVSFLPADVSSSAFNRETPWGAARQNEVMPAKEELPLLKEVLDAIVAGNKKDFENGFIAESPGKLAKIHTYYCALHGLNPFPYKKCNAPWVSAVIEADGAVRPCFFHNSMGNIRDHDLGYLLNSPSSVAFRKNLDMEKDDTCARCVCSLNLPASVNPARL